MRKLVASGSAFVTVAIALLTTSQVASAASAPAAPTVPAASTGAASPLPAPKSASASCANPDALGIARVVEIDTTGGPAFGTEHFKQYDFLRDREVVLTFDDGPWPENTPTVLKALQDNCAKATFFEIGEHATWRPDLTKELVAAGMTVGSHTWSHKDLAKNPYAKDIEQAKQEIEMGVSAVHMAAGAASPPPAPKSASASCANPDGLGISRVVEIDTTGGPAFGTEHFKQYDFLRDKEVVLTFDDGPWPENTPAVLKALQDNCAKATFFEIGEHATWRPDLTKETRRRRHDGRQPYLVA